MGLERYFKHLEHGIWSSDQHNYPFDYTNTYLKGIVLSDMELTGLLAPNPQRDVVVPIQFTLLNGSCTIKHGAFPGGSHLSNLFWLPNEEDIVVELNVTYWFFYDDVFSKWYLIMRS